MPSIRNIARYWKTQIYGKPLVYGSLDADESIEQDLANPDWGPIENHFSCEVSPHLKKHYSDRNLLSATLFEVNSPWITLPIGVHVRCFSPLNAASVIFFEGLENYIQIARGVLGGRYIMDPRHVDPMVYLHYWDIGRDPEWFRSTGLTLKQFLFSPRYESEHEKRADS